MLWRVRSSLAFLESNECRKRGDSKVLTYLSVYTYTYSTSPLLTSQLSPEITFSKLHKMMLNDSVYKRLLKIYWMNTIDCYYCDRLDVLNKLIIHLQSIILHRGFVGSQVSVTWINTVVSEHLKCWKSKSFRGKSEIKAELIPGELQLACIRYCSYRVSVSERCDCWPQRKCLPQEEVNMPR